MADVYGTPTLDDVRQRGFGTVEAQPPGPGFFASIVHNVPLGYKISGTTDDWLGQNQSNYEDKGRDAVLEALQKRGWNRQQLIGDVIDNAYRGGSAAAPAGGFSPSPEPDWSRAQQLWHALQTERAKDPNFLGDMGDVHDQASLASWADRQRSSDEDRFGRQRAGGVGGFIGNLIGGMGHGVTHDPTALIGPSAVESAGGSIAMQILKGSLKAGAVNAGLAAAQEPFVALQASRRGRPVSLEQATSDVGTSFALGAVLGGAGEGLHIALGGHKPGAVADAAEAAIAPDIRTPDEQAAINVLRRDGEVADASPFEPGPAGDDFHRTTLDATLEGLARSGRAGIPAERTVSRSALLAGTADPASLRFPARERFKAAVRQAESGGNDHAPPNPRSSASGRYQFTLRTFLSYFKRRYGSAGLSNDAIWAKRFDPNLQDVLMDDLTADNAHMLARVGAPETAANLYLMHFAGPEGVKVLEAEPGTPVRELLGHNAIVSNPFLKDWTAAELRAWTERKMGGLAGGARDGGARALDLAPTDTPEGAALDGVEAELADRDATEALAGTELEAAWADRAADPEIPPGIDRPALKAEMFPSAEDHAAAQVALWREQDAREGFAHVVDDTPAPAVETGPEPVAIEAKGRAPMRRSGPVDVMQAIADAGGIADNQGHDLAVGRGIPAFVRGAGKIIRDDGRTVDAIGEHLHDLGFFGPPSETPRPSEADVLDMIERATRKKIYTPEDAALVAERKKARLGAAQEADVRHEIESAARDAGLELDETTIDHALHRRALGDTNDEAIGHAIEAAARREAPEPAPLQAGVPPFEAPTGPEADAQTADIEHDLRMEAEAGVPAVTQKPEPNIGKLWQMSRKDLEHMLKVETLSEKEQLVDALGEERAKEFERLDRARNNTMDTRKADQAAKEFQEKFGNLTPDQERLIYGVYGDASADDIKHVLRSYSDVIEGDDLDWISYMSAHAAVRLRPEDMAAVLAGKGSVTAQAEMVRMRLAYDAMKKQGVAADRIPEMMARALVDRGGWRPEQAAELIGSFVDGVRSFEGARPAPVAAALPAPPPKELPPPETFRIGDDGEEVDLRTAVDGLDEDLAAVDAIRACLKPGAGA